MTTTDKLAAFDAAIAAELPRVYHLEYDSHEICKHFAGKVRERLLAAHDAEQALPRKERPDFMAGYAAGLADGRRCAERDSAEQAAKAVPAVRVADVGFRWDGEKQQHVPTLLVEFEPVPANSGSDAKGWRDRDAMAAMLAAAPTPPAPEAKSCLITGTCKHGSWCSEVYCQEHCQFVEEQAAPEAQRRERLTRQQIDKIMTKHYPLDSMLSENVDAFEECVRDIEATLGIGTTTGEQHG